MTNVVFRIMIICFSLALMAPATAEQYYKWVDDEGVTHYGAEKPEGKDASRVDAHNPPSSSQKQELKELEQQREQTERQASEEEDQEEGESEEDLQAENKERCKQHRKNLKVLNNKPTVRRKNPETGKREVLDQQQRKAMIEKTKKELEQCKDNQQKEGNEG